MFNDQFFSTEERRRRQEAIDYAIASGELSSSKIEASTQERARLDVVGQLSWSEYCDLQR